MPIYNILTDKITVVLDIGSYYTKFGFCGEYAPRYIVPTQVTCSKTNQVRKLIDYKDEADLYDLLVDFIHTIYFKYAQFSPKDKSVVLVESLLTPTVFRETLAKVLFLHYEINLLLVVPSHLASVAPIGVETALVLDVGYLEATIIPVCHGFPVIPSWQALPLGSQVVHNNLRSLLATDNTGIANLPESVIEDIAVRCCFVTTKKRAEQLSLPKTDLKFALDVEYPVGGSEIIKVTGKTREKAYEIFYEEDLDHLCLSTMILDAILSSNLHLRNVLAENILLVGGTTMVPGFTARLADELKKQMKSERYKSLQIKKFKFHSAPSKKNYTAWLGGSLSGATELLQMKGLTRETYMEEKRLPDWANLKDHPRSI